MSGVPTTGSPRSGSGRLWLPAGLWLVVALVWACVPAMGASNGTLSLVVSASIYAVMAYGVMLLFGSGGIMSMAHGGLWGIGAYGATLLAIHLHWSWWLALPAGMLLCAVAAAVVGASSLRLRGPYFLIVTFAFAQLVAQVASNWDGVTGGEQGLPVPLSPGIGNLFTVHTVTQWYYVSGVAVVVAIVATGWIRRSDFGCRLVAVRENESLAQAVSINSTRIKLIAFAISGVLAGASGVLWAQYINYVSPEQFGAQPALLVILMVLLGGSRVLGGPLLGALLVVIVPQELGLSPTANLIVFGALVIAVILIFPEGILGRATHALAGARLPVRRSATRAPQATAAVDPPRPAAWEFTAGAQAHHEGDLLAVSGITKNYGGVQALRGVDLTLGDDELLGVLGPNGSGKSTLFGIMTGFIAPTAGAVLWKGADITGMPAHERARAGLVRTFQERTVFAGLTVAENLRSGLVGARRDASGDAVTALAEYVGLAHRLPIDGAQLSWGEARLLGIALAIAQSPRALLLDEPFAGLSPVAAQNILDVLRRVRNDGCTVMVIDHEMAYLLPICDRIVVLDNGAKIFDGDPELLARDEGVVSAYLGERHAEL